MAAIKSRLFNRRCNFGLCPQPKGGIEHGKRIPAACEWTVLYFIFRAGFSKQTHSEPALITGCFAKPTCLSKNGLEGKRKGQQTLEYPVIAVAPLQEITAR